jgi:Mn-dependent DtxR family transcriptional regulator
MYKVGKDIGIPNTQVDDIVNDLANMGLIKKIGETKILLTFEGKQEVESSKTSEFYALRLIFNAD